MTFNRLSKGLLLIFRYYAKKKVVFILGCQRSGTTMLLKILGKNRCISVYGEGHHKAMVNYRLRSQPVIQKLVRRDPNKTIVFKPLNDLQYSDQLLDYWTDTKAVWIYRHYSDTANSAVKKWGPAHKKIVTWIKERKDRLAGESDEKVKDFSTYLERMSLDTFHTISNLAHEDMSAEDGAALMWYMRNAFFFDLNLPDDQRVILINYEDFVNSPQRYVKIIFDFIDCPIHDNYWEGIYASSIRKHTSPELSQPIADVCENMFRKLEGFKVA